MFTVLPYGCYGSTLGKKQSITMSLSDSCIIDAGGLLTALPAEHLDRITDIVITHIHYDHVKDLPPFADYLLSFLGKSVTLHLTQNTADHLKKYLFNDVLWPDFTRLPRSGPPTIQFSLIEPGTPFVIGDIELLPVAVDHIVESIGFILRKNGVTIGYSGDTCICDNLVNTINATPDIQALFYEVSFPDRLKKLANLSKHMCPAFLFKELDRIAHTDIPVYIFHQKPGFIDEIRHDLESYPFTQSVHLLKQKQPIQIS